MCCRNQFRIISFIVLFAMLASQSQAQEKELTQDDYGFQLNDYSIPSALPYGYESLVTFELDTKLYPHLKYKVGFWVTAKTSPKWEHYTYDFSLFPNNRFDTPTQEDSRLSRPTDLKPSVKVNNYQHSEKDYLGFEVSPDTTYTHITIGLDQRNGDYSSYKAYIDISNIFVQLISSADDSENNVTIEEETMDDDRELVDKGESFMVNEDTFTMSLYDHKSIDDDIVTIYLNNEVIVDKLTLKRKKEKFKGKLKSGKNTIRLHANNLGKIPPNTVAVIIRCGKQKIHQVLTSDLDKSEYFTLIFNNK